jgi:hypothetical protein
MASVRRSWQLAAASKQEAEALEARRVRVLRHMNDLMREMGCSEKFSDPNEWLKTVTERDW